MPKFNARLERHFEKLTHTQAPNTLRSNRARANNLILAFGELELADITEEHITNWLNKQHRVWSNKTINEHLTLLRAVFSSGVNNDLIVNNPVASIQNLKTVFKEPMPFSLDEIEQIYRDQALCPIAKALVIVGSVTGLRISELLGLAWDDVSIEHAQLRVVRGKSAQGYRVPKTHSSIRSVDLNQHALAQLEALKSKTGNKAACTVQVLQADNKTYRRESIKHVFINSKTGKAFIDGKQFAKTFLTPTLEALNIAHRGPGQIRHTFASQTLTAGVNMNYIAKQMGHVDTDVIRKHYARWMQQDAQDNAKIVGDSFNRVFGEGAAEAQIIVPSSTADATSTRDATVEAVRLAVLFQSNPNLASALSSLLATGGPSQ